MTDTLSDTTPQEVPVSATIGGGIPAPGEFEVSLEARRIEVVRRLIDRGMPMRALEALLPGWEEAIAAAQDAEFA